MNRSVKLKPISQEQLQAEAKCMRELEMMWSRAFSREMERQAKQLLKDEPRLAYMNPDEIIQEDNIKRATCELCGIICHVAAQGHVEVPKATGEEQG